MMNDRVTREEAERTALPKYTSIEFVLSLGGLALLFALLYATEMLLSPFIIILTIVVVMYPLRAYPAAKNLMIFSVVLFALWFVRTIEFVLAPFVVALILAYLLHPVVTRIERWNVPRWTSALFIILCAVSVIFLVLIGVVPLIVQQLGSIIQTFNTITQQFTAWLMNGSVFRTLRRYGISSGQLRDALGQTFAPRVQDMLKGVLQGAFGLVSKFEAVLTGIVNIVIVPFLTFFMLRDFPLVKHRVKMLVPSERREEAITYYQFIDDIVGGYLRGALIIAIFDGIMISISFWLIGFPYAMVIGLMSAMLTFLPYVGLITMILITTVASSVSPDHALLQMLLGIGVVGMMHVLETYVLGPKIIGGKIGLHPVMLILSLLVFGYFLGFIGLLIAIPAAASMMMIGKEWEKRRKATAQETPVHITPP